MDDDEFDCNLVDPRRASPALLLVLVVGGTLAVVETAVLSGFLTAFSMLNGSLRGADRSP
jgi:hypothetical protein